MEKMTVAEALEKYKDYLVTFPEELQKKAKECTSTEELISLIGQLEGELPDELAEAVAGGNKDEAPVYSRPTEFPCMCKILKPICRDTLWSFPWAEVGCETYVTKRSEGLYVAMSPRNRKETAGILVNDLTCLGFLYRT